MYGPATRLALAFGMAAVIFSVEPQAAEAASETGGFSVRGIGAHTCADLTARMTHDEDRSELEAFGGWISGYLTHANRVTDGVYDAIPVIDNRIIAQMSLNICTANPDSMVETAVANIVQSFERGALAIESPIIKISHDGNATVLRGEVLRMVQRELIEQDHLPANAADGDYGPQTREALMAFQADRGIASTGIPDAATLINLFLLGAQD